MPTEEDIKIAIDNFANSNSINIDNYRSPKERVYGLIPDRYIANSVFSARIAKWLEMCGGDEVSERAFLSLLSEYIYFPMDRYQFAVGDLIEDIIMENDTVYSKVLFITRPSPDRGFSGGDPLRTALVTYCEGITRANIVDYFDDVVLDEKEYSDIELVMFIDDIIGSGTTMKNLVEAVVKNNHWVSEKVCYIACVCGRERKIKQRTRYLKSLVPDIRSKTVITINKCFNDKDNVDKNIIEPFEIRINDKENLLDDDGEDDCTFGYERNKLLISFFYNTPNNTLSSFWRKTKVSPNPLFSRLVKRRPSVSDLSKSEKSKKNLSYDIAKELQK